MTPSSPHTGTPAPTGGQDPADERPRLSALVIYVRDLDQSAAFYGDLLRMEIATRDTTALLLTDAGGSMVVLRAMPRGEHSLGGVGVQATVWTARDPEDLSRCEHLLRERDAHVETTTVDGRTVVEGRDPNGLTVMVAHPRLEPVVAQLIMNRAYAW
ncbi:VOC family protein [Streptomyces sp. NPDC002574]|uniref:VOC family protein n=1 Tax=Streptomyces sp. NPDC002574 TaxID=3364652 RepID=UPI00367441F9